MGSNAQSSMGGGYRATLAIVGAMWRRWRYLPFSLLVKFVHLC